MPKDISKNTLKIEPLITKKSGIKNRVLMEEDIIMRHPSNTLISSCPGSGKSCLIYNLLSKPIYYGPSMELLTPEQQKHGPRGYFDAIFLFIPSGDDAYDPLINKGIIKPNHVCIKPTEADLARVLESQKKIISDLGNIAKAPKILCIFDDCVKEKKFLMSNSFLELFSASRHLNSSCIITTQYLNLIPKSIRIMCDILICFKMNRAESDILTEQYCPPLMPKEKFKQLIFDTTKDDPDNKHNFLMIFRKINDINKRFRKNIGGYIQMDNKCTLTVPRARKIKCESDSEKENDVPIKLEEFEPELDEDLEKKNKESQRVYPRTYKNRRPLIFGS